jgi:hypothetical protein
MPGEIFELNLPSNFNVDFNEIQQEDDKETSELNKDNYTEQSSDEVSRESINNDDLPDVTTEAEDEEPSDNEYKDYSDAALIALSEIKSGLFDELDEKDIPKDLDPIALRDLYRKSNEIKLQSEVDRLSSQAEEANKYVKYLLEGGNPQAVEEALAFNDLIKLNPTEEANQKILIAEEMRSKGIPNEDIEDLVDNLLDKGKGEVRAKQALEFFKKAEDLTLENYKKEQDYNNAQREAIQKQYVNTIKSTVEKGEVAGVKLSKTEQKQIIDAMFLNTEVVEIVNPNTNKPVKMKVPKIQVLQNELNNNPEKQVAYAYWLLKDGNFKFAKEEGKQQERDILRNVLLNRKSNNTSNKNNNSETYNKMIRDLTGQK